MSLSGSSSPRGEPVGVTCRLLERRGDLVRVSTPPPPVLLDKGGEVFQGGLGQILGGKGLQDAQAGGAEQVIKGGCLTKGAEGQEEQG
jgi:hypothetical protein